MFVAIAVATLVVVVGVVMWSYGTGPAYDSRLAERSLVAAVERAHPRWQSVAAHCDGQRDGSNFFGCTVYSQGRAFGGYGVGYDDDTHRYTASTADPVSDEGMEFPVAR